jgi:hypothetical protein
MPIKKLLLSSLVVLAFTNQADAEPAWCKPVAGKLMHGNLKDALTSNDPRDAIPSIVDILCHARSNTEEANRAREVEAARQRMMKRLAMTEADWSDAAEWASEHQGKLMSTSLDYDRKKAWSALSSIEQFAAIAAADEDASYVADAFGPKLTEVGRFSYILWCFGSRRGPVDWAVCQPDIDQLDRAKFAAELRGVGTAYQRMALRIDLVEYDAKLKEHAAAVKAALGKDGAYQKVFAAAAAGRKTWSTTDAKLADAALAMDDARITNSRRGFEGCHDKTWPALRAAIAAIPAKQFAVAAADERDGFDAAAGMIANTPNGYLAALAYVICKRAGERQDYFARSLGGAMQRWPGYRGQRTAAVSAIMNSGIELDDRDAKLEYPSTNHDWLGGTTGASGGGKGVIASVKSSGATAVVTFAKQLEQAQSCTNRKTSNRIVQIRSDGGLVYESWCAAYKTITVDRSSPPQTIAAHYAERLKPGMVAWIVEDVVTFAWAKNGAKQPAIVAGVEVK